jgi:hypothetical protein
MTREFDDLVDTDELDPLEEERLRRIHDLLVEAGPPPDLPPALEHPAAIPRDEDAEIVQFPLLPRRRAAVAVLIAAAISAIAFGGGYLLGHRGQDGDFSSTKVVPMRGAGNALASIRIGHRDSVGNWPMEMIVNGLPQQPNPRAYYSLYLTRNGKPVAPCGTFRVHGKTTRIRFTVPYKLTRFDGWVVTRQPAGVHTPGHVVLSTA